jgi:precorrin-6B methylase 2
VPFRKQLLQFDDHRDLLADEVRMRAYAAAIERAVQPGDRVIDLGAGVGILGFMALRAGDSHVYALEKTDSIELARRLAVHNGLADQMTFFAGSSLDFELEEPADVLLSETLGSFGVEENTLVFTADARKRLLRDGGRMVPAALRLWLAPVRSETGHGRLRFWDRVEGFDFSPAVDAMLGRMSTVDVSVDDLLAQPQIYAELDLGQADVEALRQRLLFPIVRPGTIHGVAGWFEAQLIDDVYLATGPGLPATHWRQAFFPLRTPVEVTAGDYFELTLAIGPDPAKGPQADDTAVQLDYRCTQLGGAD